MLGILTIASIIGMIHISYIPVRKGRLYLKNADTTITLLREKDTGIQHIEAESLEMAIYAQGFGHA